MRRRGGGTARTPGPAAPRTATRQHAGFFNQGYGMAHQWARYRVEIPNGKYNYQPGRTYDILWNVAESGCGGAPVTIQNLATASLYVYTPYQPNPASLAAYPGEGDACSAYGNRNFFRMFQTYFGSTGGGIATGAPAAVGGGGSAGAIGAVPVVTSGATVTIPSSPYSVWRGKDYAGTVITAPTPGIAAGIAAGMAYLGLQYSWGGGNADGPTLGIHDGGKAGDANGDYNRVGFDCSGLTTYVAARYPAAIPRLVRRPAVQRTRPGCPGTRRCPVTSSATTGTSPCTSASSTANGCNWNPRNPVTTSRFPASAATPIPSSTAGGPHDQPSLPLCGHPL